MSGATSKLFLARLAGMQVFDPNGDQVGKVRDVILTLAAPDRPPRVLGLVLEVPPRRRIFLPIGRVKSFTVAQIVVTGLVNMRRFRKRESETLAFAEILDKKVKLRESNQSVTVIDIGIDLDRQRDWIVRRWYVRRGGGFGRKGETFVVDYNDVETPDSHDPTQGADELLNQLEGMRAADVAETINELPTARRMQIAQALGDARLADVLEELPEEDQVEILGVLDVERAADVLEEMDPDDATDLVSELPAQQADLLLQRMEPDDADDIRRLLKYGERTAGGLMTTEPVVLDATSTVVDALAVVRQPDLTPATASQIYVVRPPTETPTGKFLGAVHIQALLRVPPATLISELVDKELEPVSPATGIPELARYFAAYNLVAAPVVDEGDHLLGSVTVDDLVDHMLPDDWRLGRVGGES